MKATRREYMGHVAQFFSEYKGPKTDLLEISGNTTEWHAGYTNVTTTQFPQVDAENLPYGDAYFDTVIMNQVLEHCRRPWLCVAETYRVLRKGGIAILSSPFFYQVHNHPGDFYRYTPEGLICLAEDAGYSEVLLNSRAGNREMIKHVIDHPKDRKSPEFEKLSKLNSSKKEYFMISTVVVKK